jgi:hypothetical protein
VCPNEVLVLLRHGVEIHSVTNLHAKVFVIDRSVFIGSTNVSQSSANTLVEAVVHGTEHELVRQSTRFVDSLRGEHVTSEFARRMAKIYRPPKITRETPTARRDSKVTPGHARTWVVQLSKLAWDDEDYLAEEKGRPIARRRIRSPRRFEVESFCWTSAGFAKRARAGDLVVQVLKESPRRYMVSPPERVLYIRNYRNKRNRRSFLVFLETPKALRRKTLQSMRQALGRAASVLRQKSNLTLLRDSTVNHRLHQLWPRIS